MKHRDIDFDVNEVAPSEWRWTIYQKLPAPKVVGKISFATHDEAVEACRQEIDDGLDWKNNA